LYCIRWRETIREHDQEIRHSATESAFSAKSY
jgi:hypothetical protein